MKLLLHILATLCLTCCAASAWLHPGGTLIPQPVTIVFNITDYTACDGMTNDAPGFDAFHTAAIAAQGMSPPYPQIVLNIPNGAVCSWTSVVNKNQPFTGIKNILISGYGATFDGSVSGFDFASKAGIQPLLMFSSAFNIQDVSAGATQVTMVTHADAANYTVGQYTLVGGFQLQDHSQFPPALHYFDWVKVTSANATSGVVTFDRALTNTYLSTWPSWSEDASHGATYNEGGPGVLFVIDPDWDTQFEAQGLHIIPYAAAADAINSLGRDITYRDVTIDTSGINKRCINSSQNLTMRYINFNNPGCGIEQDKLVHEVVFDTAVIKSIQFQTSAIDLLTMTNSTLMDLEGTPKVAHISDSTFIDDFQFGAILFGRSDEVVCTNCTMPSLSQGGTTYYGVGGTTILNTYSISGGVFTGTLSDVDNAGNMGWAIPGTNVFFKGRDQTELLFHVLSVTHDATNMYVTTDYMGTYTNLPTDGSGRLILFVHPAPKFTCTSCSGSAIADMWSTASPAIPWASFVSLDYDGVPQHGPSNNTWGVLSSIEVNVTTAYTGTHGTLLTQIGDGGLNTLNPDGTAPCGCPSTFYSPSFNFKTAGDRIVLSDGTVTCNGSMGGCSGDANLAQPVPLWSTSNSQPVGQFDISGESMGVRPAVHITIHTDQGVIIP